jgi:hypothetical protein
MSTAARVLPFLADEDRRRAEVTHEAFIHAVRAAVVGRVVDLEARERLLGAKLVYGSGPAGVRGVCYFEAWQNGAVHDFLEIAATGEESVVQLAGTTIHELAHSLAGREHGHGPAWKAACKVLGLTTAQAGGQAYSSEHFDVDVWGMIDRLPHPSDGRPQFKIGGRPMLRVKPCPLGVGTRGGRPPGPGARARGRRWVCGCPEGTPGRKVRVACDEWDATCNRCRIRYSKDPR